MFKSTNLIYAATLMSLAAASPESDIHADRQTFEDFIEMYGNGPKYSPEEKAL
jgi:hypothetical protein